MCALDVVRVIGSTFYGGGASDSLQPSFADAGGISLVGAAARKGGMETREEGRPCRRILQAELRVPRKGGVGEVKARPPPVRAPLDVWPARKQRKEIDQRYERVLQRKGPLLPLRLVLPCLALPKGAHYCCA